MDQHSHDKLVEQQFSPQAAAYVASPVHSQGEDLIELAELARAFPAARALDLGCGGGHVAYALAPVVAQVVACDLSEAMLEAVRAEAARRGLTNLTTREGKAEALPFEEGSFDLLASRYSAHHWDDLAAGLRESRRVLKPGGTAVFMDVASAGTPTLDTWLQTLELLRDPSHLRNYSLAEWSDAVARAGFTVRRVTQRRLPLEFTPWIQRMRTPEVHAAAIRSLQARMPAPVARHFALQPDGGFTLDTVTLEAVAV